MNCKIVNLLVGLVILQTGCNKEEKKPDRYSILFIMTDDHSCQTLSAYSDKLIVTPNLDLIAAEVVMFKNSFVCNFISAPNRVTLLAGKQSQKNDQKPICDTFYKSQGMFPKLLRHADSQTEIIGKRHLKSNPTGFYCRNILFVQGQIYNLDFIELVGKRQNTGYCTALTTDFDIQWHNERDIVKPFCLLLHYRALYGAWQPDTQLFNNWSVETNRNLTEKHNFPYDLGVDWMSYNPLKIY